MQLFRTCTDVIAVPAAVVDGAGAGIPVWKKIQ